MFAMTGALADNRTQLEIQVVTNGTVILMKSPLKDKPLRNPGQSLDRRIFDVILDQQIKYVIYGMAGFGNRQ